MINRVRVFVEEHIPEGNPDLRTRQMWPFRTVQEGTDFEFDHVRTFEPPQEEEATSTIPVTTGFTTGLMTTTVTNRFPPVTLSGNPRNDPYITKSQTPAILAGTSSDESSDSSSNPFVGPEIDLSLKGDLTEWSATEWLPGGTSLHLYIRTLFGSFEVFDVESDAKLYSAGPRLLVPIVAIPEFGLGATLSAGLAYLQTDIGDTLGFEAMAGLRAQVPIAGGLAGVAELGFGFFTAENVYSWGPTLNAGLVFAW